MKLHFKSLRAVVVALMSLVATACSESEPIVVSGLTLSQLSVVFDANGGECIVSVVPFPENESWKIDGQLPEWVGVEAVEEGVRVVAQANTAGKERAAQFSIVSPKDRFEPYVVTVSQEGGDVVDGKFVTSAAESYTFDSEGGTYRFTVLSKLEWSVEDDAEWLEVEYDRESGVVELSALPNEGSEGLTATLLLLYTLDGELRSVEIAVMQQTRAENPYLNLLGKWEITATKWYYSPNGSLNSLDYAPSPTDYYLIFDIEQGEYGKTLVMRNFLYPNTALEVRYDGATGGFVIPFGWTVLSYDVFLYITVVQGRKFSYASLEVDVTPTEDKTMLAVELPTVDGFDDVGFGLWTYDDNENKVALGSSYRPTMFPMGSVVLRKQIDGQEE